MSRYAIFISILALVAWQAYSFGVEHQAGKEAKLRQELQELQSKYTTDIQKQKAKIEVKYRDRIKTIYKTVDPTGCLDTTLGDIGLYKHSGD